MVWEVTPSQPAQTYPLGTHFYRSTPYFDRSPQPPGFLLHLPSNYTSSKTYWTCPLCVVR